MTVVIVYLLYTIYETDYWMRRESDFYQDLGLNLDADEKKIKSKFRRLYVPLTWLKTILTLKIDTSPELQFIIQTK